MAEVVSLTCPKCGGAMRTFERSGITIDQCTECRGVFLDRGELERLIDAESAAYTDREVAEPRGYAGYGEGGEHGGYGEHGGRRRRRGFLGDLFEGGH